VVALAGPVKSAAAGTTPLLARDASAEGIRRASQGAGWSSRSTNPGETKENLVSSGLPVRHTALTWLGDELPPPSTCGLGSSSCQAVSSGTGSCSLLDWLEPLRIPIEALPVVGNLHSYSIPGPSSDWPNRDWGGACAVITTLVP